jgi:flagellar biosynthetic protein FlhB
MAEQDFDLSEEATPHKLDQARKRGTVAKSQELMAVAVLATMATMLYATGWDSFKQTVLLERQVVAQATRLDWTVDGVAAWMSAVMFDALHVLAPLLFALAVVSILINVVQTGPVFTTDPLKPDFTRLNPVNGFKRFFSMRIVYEAVKSVFKLAVLATVAYFAIRDRILMLIGLSMLDPKGYAKELIVVAASLLFKLVFALLIIALVDVVYTRWEFAKRMRMSRRDVRDEVKHREGDPRVRARLRELRREALRRSKAMRKLPSADVLITNPTHVAVALTYDHGKVGAPQVVAKGAGELARKMRQIASRHHIPVVQNKPLARALFREVDYDGFVPEKWYPQVAKIMVWVYAMRDVRAKAGRAEV